MIFENDRDTLYWRILAGRVSDKETPLLVRYELEALDFQTAKLTVYEKRIVGCFLYMDHYMYFDQEGVIQDSSRKLYSKIPVVSGLEFGHVSMMQPLPVENPKIFTYLLNLMQLIEINDIKVAKTVYDKDLNVTLYLSDPETIKVNMGSPDHMQDKILTLRDILPQLKDLSGTLYLDAYDPTSYEPKYYFKKDTEEDEKGGKGEKPSEEPTENPTEAPAEKPAEVPVENPAEVPAENPAEVPAEN